FSSPATIRFWSQSDSPQYESFGYQADSIGVEPKLELLGRSRRQRDDLIDRVPVSGRRRHAKLLLEKVVGKRKEAVLLTMTNHESRAIFNSKHFQIFRHRVQRQFWFDGRLSGQKSDERSYVVRRFDLL